MSGCNSRDMSRRHGLRQVRPSCWSRDSTEERAVWDISWHLSRRIFHGYTGFHEEVEEAPECRYRELHPSAVGLSCCSLVQHLNRSPNLVYSMNKSPSSSSRAVAALALSAPERALRVACRLSPKTKRYRICGARISLYNYRKANRSASLLHHSGQIHRFTGTQKPTVIKAFSLLIVSVTATRASFGLLPGID